MGTNGQPSAPQSPCIGVCVIDRAQGRCVGCLRTLAEIARWPAAPDRERRQLLQELAQRRRAVQTGHDPLRGAAGTPQSSTEG